VVVLDVEVGDVQRSGAVAEGDPDAAPVDRNGPEKAVVGARVEVMDLGRVTRVLEDVQSDEGERALPMAPV
jgi:hypothetical protein